ncbi:MAG: MlaD family protein [Candidatus Omnitrophica bacterium]|nr:MlaD family protein [Candidatus Omnitrophota bacterium]
MEKKEFSIKLYAGLFFIIGVILIGVVVLTIGMERGLTQPKFTAQVLFSQVGGLSIGAPVRLSGVNVGTVGKIDFLDEEVDGRHVVVSLSLFKRYKKQIEKAYSFEIKTEGVLGQKLIAISKDPSGNGRKLDIAKPLVGEDPLDVQDLARTFGQTAVSLQDTAKGMAVVMNEVDDNFKKIKRVLNRIEERLIDGNLFTVF